MQNLKCIKLLKTNLLDRIEKKITQAVFAHLGNSDYFNAQNCELHLHVLCYFNRKETLTLNNKRETAVQDFIA